MNVVIDHGNSAAKVGIFNHQNLVEKRSFQSERDLRDFLSQATIRNLMVSSVTQDPRQIASWAPREAQAFVLSPGLPMPVKSVYKTPETIGVDRLAAACGAEVLFPNTNCLVIDAGTCITYDFVDANANHLGGAISPGLAMRFRSLHTFTARLPLVHAVDDVPLIGDSTASCMQSGVVNGLMAEVNGIIEAYQARFEGVRVVLCGGDTSFFENKLKASIFASPELVLIGLNSILEYNVTR